HTHTHRHTGGAILRAEDATLHTAAFLDALSLATHWTMFTVPTHNTHTHTHTPTGVCLQNKTIKHTHTHTHTHTHMQSSSIQIQPARICKPQTLPCCVCACVCVWEAGGTQNDAQK